MTFTIKGHDFKYETRNIISIFLPSVKVEYSDSDSADFISVLSDKTAFARVNYNGKTAIREMEFETGEEEYYLCKALYFCFIECLGITPAWGMLTGIRPVKLLTTLKKRENSLDKAVKILKEKYFVTDEKIELLLETAVREDSIISKVDDNGFSLYIGIPFCPSRCYYCSFVSHAIENATKLVGDYLESLIQEIEYTGKITKELGITLQSIYIGGGTPTSLNECQLEKLLVAIKNNFDFNSLLEYTCEAGRPDTINREKLRIMKEQGVDRISINPQSMEDSVLKKIGRRHSVDDVVNCLKDAKEIGFNSINMDLIAGLKGETVQSFARGLEKVIALDPDNITVHSLTIKRAADLADKAEQVVDTDISEMVANSYKTLKSAGYTAYYMYRQKNTLGGLENVGYSKDGKDGAYNVLIMAEVQSIVSLGAGGVTKLYNKSKNLLHRVFNYKFPYEYIKGIDVLLKRKDEITKFYNEMNSEK